MGLKNQKNFEPIILEEVVLLCPCSFYHFDKKIIEIKLTKKNKNTK